MRIAAAITGLLAFALMAGAAYLRDGWWQLSLFADVVAWTVAALLILVAVAEHFAGGRRAWARAGVALFAAVLALGESAVVTPGKLDPLPFRLVVHSGASLAALGCVAAAIGLGWATLRIDERRPNVVAAFALVLACAALRGWVHHG